MQSSAVTATGLLKLRSWIISIRRQKNTGLAKKTHSTFSVSPYRNIWRKFLAKPVQDGKTNKPVNKIHTGSDSSTGRQTLTLVMRKLPVVMFPGWRGSFILLCPVWLFYQKTFKAPFIKYTTSILHIYYVKGKKRRYFSEYIFWEKC